MKCTLLAIVLVLSMIAGLFAYSKKLGLAPDMLKKYRSLLKIN